MFFAGVAAIPANVHQIYYIYTLRRVLFVATQDKTHGNLQLHLNEDGTQVPKASRKASAKDAKDCGGSRIERSWPLLMLRAPLETA